jgi:hypothetical protein
MIEPIITLAFAIIARAASVIPVSARSFRYRSQRQALRSDHPSPS